MKSCEKFVSEQSDYFIYSPSKLARKMFLYPMQCGVFTYLPGYSLTRQSFDSFLLMYVQKGELELYFEGERQKVKAGQFVLLDCYKCHGYSSDKGWTGIWCHFDGAAAREYYDAAVLNLGNVFSLPDPYPVVNWMMAILKPFFNNAPIKEPLCARYLTEILTELLLFTPGNICTHGSITEEAVAYISEHFREELPVEVLAARAGISLYHFIRIFKKESGFTPHEYLINVRIATAKYLLKNSQLTVKEICFASGFSSESVFCNAFKRMEGTSPGKYRQGGNFKTLDY